MAQCADRQAQNKNMPIHFVYFIFSFVYFIFVFLPADSHNGYSTVNPFRADQQAQTMIAKAQDDNALTVSISGADFFFLNKICRLGYKIVNFIPKCVFS